MAGAMEAIAANTIFLIDIVRQAVDVGDRRDRGMKGCVKAGNLYRIGQGMHRRTDTGQIRRVMKRGQIGETLNGTDNLIRNDD